jgi:uncharacterized protein with HEPN domain
MSSRLQHFTTPFVTKCSSRRFHCEQGSAVPDHISECIGRIEAYTVDGREAFLRDAKTQDAVLRNLQVLAESTDRLSDEAKNSHPAIDWRGIKGFRNILTHDYLGVDIERVWQMIEVHLPALRRAVAGMLQRLADDE